MSWNPRRFVTKALDQAATVDGNLVLTPRKDAAERGLGNTPVRLVWLTADVIERIESAAKAGALQLTQEPFPEDEALIVGFARPTPFLDSEAAFTLVPGLDAQVDTNRLIAANLYPRWPHSAHRELAWREAQSGVRLSYHFNSDGELAGASPVGPVSPDPFRAFGTIPASADNGARMNALVRAAWTLLNTPLEREVTATVTAAQQVSVGKKRRARDYPVSLIDVRRAPVAGCTSTGRRIEHDHRWSVRGHWRNQACGPGRTQRRRVWIEGYVAGPTDKPLRVRPRVNVIRHAA